MDQERLVSTITTGGRVTGELILKAIWYMIKAARERKAAKARTKPPVGKISWKKMMATSGRKDIETFLNSEIHLKALQKELKKYGIGFAHYKHGNGQTTLLFQAKDRKVLEKALEDLGERLKGDENLKGKLGKHYKDLTATEKAEHLHKKQKLTVKVKAMKAAKDQNFTVKVKSVEAAEKAAEKMTRLGGKTR